MTSIDDLFLKSGVPSKRKFEPVRDPNEIYKSVKFSGNGSASRQPHVEDNGKDDIEAAPSNDDDGDFGPAPPPEDDLGDDDEGRFFGGGISKTEASILAYVDGQDDQDTNDAATKIQKKGADGENGRAQTVFDATWLRRTALAFEKRINRNAELRARYASEPTRFIASEADLDADIRALSIVGEHPELYPEFSRLGTAASLISLLAHDNTDIAIAALEIVGELTDEDVDATDEQWAALVNAFLDADLIGLLVSNLARLDEAADEADRTGVYYALSIVEHLCSFQGDVTQSTQPTQKESSPSSEPAPNVTKASKAAEVLGANDGLVRWLLQRVQSIDPTDDGSGVTQNRQYAAEILAILAQASPANCRRLVALDAIDLLLQCIAPYRRRDPSRGSEEEYMENLFEALTCLVSDSSSNGYNGDGAPATADGVVAARTKFLEAEGIELCLLLLHDGHKSRAPALRLLDYAASGVAGGAAVCRQIVQAGGLKTTFTLFMRGDENSKKHIKKHKELKKSDRLHAGPIADHLVALFASMLRLLPGDTPERIRLLAKFVERDYEKVHHTLALRTEYAARVGRVDREMDAEGHGLAYVATLPSEGDGAEEREELVAERLSRRLDAGLFTLQGIDIILAWLIAEDDGTAHTIQASLTERHDTVSVLRQSLGERRDELDTSVTEGKDMHDMLTALLEVLR